MTPRERTLKTIRQIGERYGVSLDEIFAPRSTERAQAARCKCYAELTKQGWKVAAIARLMKRHPATVLETMRLHGIRATNQRQYNRKLSPAMNNHELSPFFTSQNDGCIIATSRQSAQQFLLERNP